LQKTIKITRGFIEAPHKLDKPQTHI